MRSRQAGSLRASACVASAAAANSHSFQLGRRAFSLSEDRLKAGTIDLATLLVAQQSLFQAQEAAAQARYLRLQAAVGLFQALGGDWSAGAATGEAAKLAASVDKIPPSPLPFEALKTE